MDASDLPLVFHLLSSWQPVWQPSYLLTYTHSLFQAVYGGTRSRAVVCHRYALKSTELFDPDLQKNLHFNFCFEKKVLTFVHFLGSSYVCFRQGGSFVISGRTGFRALSYVCLLTVSNDPRNTGATPANYLYYSHVPLPFQHSHILRSIFPKMFHSTLSYMVPLISW